MRIRDVLDKRSIQLDAAPKNKQDAINMLVDLMAQSGCLSDAAQYRKAVFEREKQSSTGLGEGIALPHAKSEAVLRPALASMIVPQGVDFDSFDEEPAYLLFMIASPVNASDDHLDVLARLSTLMMDMSFRDELLAAKTVDEYLEVIDRAEARVDARDAEREAEEAAEQSENTSEQSHDSNAASTEVAQEKTADTVESTESENHVKTDAAEGSKEPTTEGRKKRVYDLVAVTACPAGLSHTFMAAEALEQKAKEMGLTIKVEADGAAGNRNSLMPEDIAAAKAVIVAADRAVDIDRFIGKRMVRTGVVDGVHRPEMLIKKALDPNCPIFKGGSLTESSNVPMRMYRHLMSGLTYILPLAATAGILSAVARLDFLTVYAGNFSLFLNTIGYSIGILLFPVLSAFIAFSLAGRTGLVAGFTGGVMADMASASIFGAVLNGFVGGGVALLIARCAQRFLKGHDAMFALLVYPLAGAVFTTVIAQFITNLPAGLLGNAITTFISTSNALTLALVGAVLGGMMSADMGGPFNKLAYALGVLTLADCLPENGPGTMVMASVMLGGMAPPIIAGIAAKFIAPRKFSAKEKSMALGAIVKGCLFITEAVLPFLKNTPRLRIACVLGSAISGAISMYFSCGVVAPHGGVFIILLAINPLHYLLALVVGSLIGAIVFALLHPNVNAHKSHKHPVVSAKTSDVDKTSSPDGENVVAVSCVARSEASADKASGTNEENAAVASDSANDNSNSRVTSVDKTEASASDVGQRVESDSVPSGTVNENTSTSSPAQLTTNINEDGASAKKIAENAIA